MMIKDKFKDLYQGAIASISGSFASIVSNYRVFSLALAMDLVFIILYGFVSGAYLSRLNEYVQAIGAVAISASGLDGAESSSIISIFLNPSTKPYLYSIMLLIIILSISIYILFSVMFSISTYLAQSLGRFDFDQLKAYIKRSFITNISWIILLVFLNFLSFYVYFTSTVSKTIGASTNDPSKLFDSMIFLVCIYFFLISISVGQRKNFRLSFSIGIRKILKLLPFYLLLMFGFVLLSFFGILLAKVGSIFILAIYEAVVVIGYLLFMRLAFKNYLDCVVSG